MSNSRENYLTEKVEDESGVSVTPDHANNFDEYHEDVVGDEECESDEEDRDKGKKRRGYDEQKDDSKPSNYMFFDVRSNEAGDKVLSIFDEERKKEVAEQGKGLDLITTFSTGTTTAASSLPVEIATTIPVTVEINEENSNMPIQTVTSMSKGIHPLKVVKTRSKNKVYNRDTSSIIIQKTIRGYLGKKKFNKIKKKKANEIYQQHFSDNEHLFIYRFKTTGAAFIIQKWFRSLKFRRKYKWHFLYRKFIEKLKKERLLYNCIRKSKNIFSTKGMSSGNIVLLNGAATVICRIIRGYLGRQRVKRLRIECILYDKLINQAAVRIQAIVRYALVRSKYPKLGQRYRMLRAKRVRWERQQSAVLKELVLSSSSTTNYTTSHHQQQQQQDDQEEEEEESMIDEPNNTVVSQLHNTNTNSNNTTNTSEDPSTNQLHAPKKQYLQKRRPSFLFLHIRLGNIEHLNSLHKPAIVIQCMWRSYKARKQKRSRIQLKKNISTTVIAAWVARLCRRWRRNKAARAIQPVWRNQVQYRRRRLIALIKMQTAWRTHITRKHFRLLLQLRQYSANKLVLWIRCITAKRVVNKKFRRLRQLTELRQAGLLGYTGTHTRWVAHYMWQGAKVKTYTSQHEMQKLFQANSVNGGMEAAKMLKIAKECKDLLSDSLTANQVEIQFAKIKNPLEKRIDYSKFVDLCVSLAVMKFMGVDPSRVTGAGTSAMDEANTTATGANTANFQTSTPAAVTTTTAIVPGTPQDIDTAAISINSFRYAGLRGKPALLTRFIAEVLYSVIDFKRAVEFLDSKHTSAGAQARSLIRQNVLAIQRFVRNRFAVNTITADLVKHKAAKILHRRTEAARKIQGCIRGFLGRRMITRMAQTMYTKFIHGETEREYWTNPRTNTSYWTKPRLLGEFDCGMATRMPKEEERYTVMCSSCSTISATCFCVQCNEPYCTMCYAVGHRSGQRKTHLHLLIDNCVQCEFQAGTRYCVSCKDMYCDSCYKFMHRRGRLRFHVMQRNCDVCDICTDLSAQWKESLIPSADNNFQHSRNWCNRCYRDEYNILPQDVPPTQPLTLTRVEFYGKTVELYKEKTEKERRQVEIAVAFDSRKKELLRQKQDKAVRFIQRVYRGYKKRQAIAEFISQRKHFMKMREEEAGERQKLLYKLTAALGFAKALQSDTPLERVMKLYPSYMHHILALSVNNDWTYACRLLNEHEEHLKTVPRSNILQRTAARLSLSWNRGKLERAESKHSVAAAQFETASQTLHIANASGALAPRKLEALKTATAKAEAQLREAAKQKLSAETGWQAAQDRLTDYEGPRGIQRLVMQRRQEGIRLPFRVSIRRHSRQALVTLWEEDMDCTEEELALKPARVPGKWRSYLSSSDPVRIRDVAYLVSVPIVAKKKLSRPSSASSVQSSDDEGGNGANSGTAVTAKKEKEAAEDTSRNASSSGTKKKRRRKLTRKKDGEEDSGSVRSKKVGTRPGSAHSASSDGSEDYSNSEYNTTGSTGFPITNPYNLELEVREEATEEHITLDHPWMLDDVFDIEIYKLLPRIFYYKPLFYLRRQMLLAYPTQKFVAVTAITLHKYSGFLEWLVNNFDEESESYTSLQRRILQTRETRDQWLSLSHSIVQMSYDFTLRRKVFGVLFKILGVSANVIKLLRGLVKNVTGGKAESPFDYWKRSMSKVDVVCVLDKGGDRTVVLGEFKLDLKAPADIMREFVKRSFRTELNTTIGDSFLFFKVDPDTGTEEVLLRENEFKTYSSAFCCEKTDAKTWVTSMTVLIIPDPSRGRVVIPEFAEESEEEKQNEELQELL